jgi:hypothetical protein
MGTDAGPVPLPAVERLAGWPGPHRTCATVGWGEGRPTPKHFPNFAPTVAQPPDQAQRAAPVPGTLGHAPVRCAPPVLVREFWDARGVVDRTPNVDMARSRLRLDLRAQIVKTTGRGSRKTGAAQRTWAGAGLQ